MSLLLEACKFLRLSPAGLRSSAQQFRSSLLGRAGWASQQPGGWMCSNVGDAVANGSVCREGWFWEQSPGGWQPPGAVRRQSPSQGHKQLEEFDLGGIQEGLTEADSNCKGHCDWDGVDLGILGTDETRAVGRGPWLLLVRLEVLAVHLRKRGSLKDPSQKPAQLGPRFYFWVLSLESPWPWRPWSPASAENVSLVGMETWAEECPGASGDGACECQNGHLWAQVSLCIFLGQKSWPRAAEFVVRYHLLGNWRPLAQAETGSCWALPASRLGGEYCALSVKLLVRDNRLRSWDLPKGDLDSTELKWPSEFRWTARILLLGDLEHLEYRCSWFGGWGYSVLTAMQ